jgi:hypothetical protein
MHKLLLSKEVDLHALSAIVNQTYAEFDRERPIGPGHHQKTRGASRSHDHHAK